MYPNLLNRLYFSRLGANWTFGHFPKLKNASTFDIMAHKDVITKVEEYEASVLSEKTQAGGTYIEGEIEDEFDPSQQFDVKEAWKSLLQLPGCVTLYLDEKLEKDMGLEVGVNVSQEFPWKQIKFRAFVDNFHEDIPGWKTFRDNLKNVNLDDLILIGYAPFLSQDVDKTEEGDPFIAFSNHASAMQAGNIIKNIEAYERWILNKLFIKEGRPWISQGSEKEVDITIPRKQERIVDVEIQSVYPIRLARSKCLIRTTADVRDGYIELVPGDKKFENIFRKRVHIGIQSAPDKVTLEQQTDPTFPTNAWSQYFYEVKEEDEGLDISDEEEKPPPSKAVTPTPGQTPIEVTRPPPPVVSNQVKQLLQTLEFNEIDMYRNDYPLISDQVVPKYTAPYMEEIVSFINIQKSFNRYVCGVDWYPTLSGLVVLSYTFSTLASSISLSDKTDVVTRSIVEPNPVLMWSFNDTLDFKLEFVAPREVTCLSFCPYDGNLLIGGTINGQVIIWDLQDRVSRLDYEEILTQAQSKYRELMQGFLAWTKPVNEEITIQPTAISVLETSQSGPITQINWLNQQHYVSKAGKVYETKKATNRFFVTTSVDGSIAFWNLDAAVDTRKQSAISRRKLPSQLVQNISALKKLDRVMKPEFMIAFPEPLAGSIFDMGRFFYDVRVPAKITRDIAAKIPIIVKPLPQDPIRPRMFTASLLGNVCSFEWEGFDFESGEAVNKEKVQLPTYFPKVHDGIVFAVLRNPHYEDIFVSIGRHILAIWKEDFNLTPIFWRKRPATLTSVRWSHERPSVLFLSRDDGYVEAWDFLTRSDDACLAEPLGGGIITAISEHRSAIPKKVLGIGDYNSSFRMILLPSSFQSFIPDEVESLKKIVEKECKRKEGIKEWEKEWCKQNADIIQSRRMAEEQIALELEKAKREADEEAARQAKIEAEEQRKAALKQKKKVVFDLPERLEKKWDEMLLRRYVEVLMERTRVDKQKLEKQTALEKDRIQYEKNKKISLRKSFKKIDENVSEARARLLPLEKDYEKRVFVVKGSIDEIVQQATSYKEVEEECNIMIENFPQYDDMNYHDFLDRGKLRRAVVNQSLGANTGRRHYYEGLKRMAKTKLMEMGFQRFISSVPSKTSMQISLVEDMLDEIPVKDESEPATDNLEGLQSEI